MPKDNIDYSNTIIYKIHCKDESVTDTYIGHTTNFTVRKHKHKNDCYGLNHELNIYSIIRANGGWTNWNMVELARYNCKTSTEAKKKTAYHHETNETNNETKSCSKVAPTFACEYCDYLTCKKSSYSKHLTTDKHIMKQNETKSCPKVAQKKHIPLSCICGYICKSRSTLWRHKKTCNNENENDTDTDLDELTDKEIIKALLHHTKHLANIVENNTNNNINLANNCNNNNTNNITNNKTFNLNLFLNETCKDAINISDFVSSVKVTLEDLEHTGRQGYIEGITNIVLNNLNKLETHLRPLHCSDLKRETIYIKNNDKWEKESEDKPILTKAIKTIANENIKQIGVWKDKHPGCSASDSIKNNLYLKIVGNSMNGLTKEEGDKNINRIISNVAKKVTILKT